MNLTGPHIHLAVNHLPAGRSVRRFALVTLVVVALAGLPALFSGEPAKEGIGRLAGTEQARVEQHEDVARTAVIVLEIAAAIGLFGLMLFRRKAVPGSLLALALALIRAGGVLPAG